MNDIYSQQARNRRITAALIAGFFLIVVLVGFSVDVYTMGTIDVTRVPVATVIAASLAGANSFTAYFYGSSLVLRSLGAEEPDPGNLSHRKLHNVVTEMALASGLPMPQIRILPDPAPNAFAVGRDPEHSVIGVTQGLLDIMNREELQAVVAHEIGHIKSRDVLTMTVVTVLLGTVSILTDWAVRTWRYGGVRPRRDIKGKGGLNPLALLVIALFVLLSPIVSRMIAMAVSRSREYQADVSAAEFTRNPLALASALEKISSHATALKSARRGTAHLFISNPLQRKLDDKDGLVADVFSTHPPIKQRIERLKKMAHAYA